MTKFFTAISILGLALDAAAAPLPLHVSGSKVLDSNNRPVLLRGVNCASLEWTSDGEEGKILETVRRAVEEWKANIIRVPLSQDRWFGAGPEQKDKGVAYRALVHRVVDYVASKDQYVMLDLHWSDTGKWGQAIGQHVMPDKNSLTFWRNFAREFRNNPAVIYDLYNEPHDTTWDIWLKGGPVTERGFDRATRTRTEFAYQAVGMQELLDAVRSVGARNVIVAGGLDWAYDLSGFLKGYQLRDPDGNGVIYACHWYPMKGDKVETWIAKMKAATKVVPVIVSEFGSENRPGQNGPNPWVAQTLEALRKNRWHWAAWDLHPAAGPRLLKDWSYEPTESFGVLVKEELARP